MKLLDERDDDFVLQLDEMLKRYAPDREPDVGAGKSRRRESPVEKRRAPAVEDRVTGDGEELDLIHFGRTS